MRVFNPDIGEIYHCWHFCLNCGMAWGHSQGNQHYIMNHKCVNIFGFEVIQTMPIWVKEIAFDCPGWLEDKKKRGEILETI